MSELIQIREKNRRRHWRLAILSSLLAHGSAIVFLAFLVLNAAETSRPQRHEIQARESTVSNEATLPDTPSASAIRPSEASTIARDIDKANQNQAAIPSSDSNSIIESQIRRKAKESLQKSAEQNRGDLSKLGERLNRISSEKSVDEMSQFLQGITGKTRENPPTESAEKKPIDPESAQIHDVEKLQDESGKPIYVAHMVDANGNSEQVIMEADIGEQLYRTMKLIKSNPLLERVYRQMVMGMIDGLLKSQEPQSNQNSNIQPDTNQGTNKPPAKN